MFKTKEPAVSDVNFDLFDRLTHAANAVEVLNDGDLDEYDRIHTRASTFLQPDRR